MNATGPAAGDALRALDEITRRLRRDCPWDREQDERSIVPHTVEEAYELADAAHSGDDAKLLDELGDVLFQVYFLALLLEERGEGDLETVARGIAAKLVRRHPHVFGDGEGALADLPTEARTPAQVRENWDAIKRTQESGSGDPLAGVPENLPALLYARKLQRRAREGDWSVDPGQALDRLRARLDDASKAIARRPDGDREPESGSQGSELIYERVGDLLFAAVALARSVEVDPELALRQSARRFRERETGA